MSPGGPEMTKGRENEDTVVDETVFIFWFACWPETILVTPLEVTISPLEEKEDFSAKF